MQVTSINIQPIKEGSEMHNTRAKALDYVREDLSHLNESWVGASVADTLQNIKERYMATTRQPMQKKATPIREGVVVISPTTTMNELKDFANRIEQRWGIKTIQIYTHLDEGHNKGEEWKANRHAHMVFDWTQPNGKSIKMGKSDMSEMQTILAESLNMERGKSSDKKHLDAVEFKVEERKKELEELAEMITHQEEKAESLEKSFLGRIIALLQEKVKKFEQRLDSEIFKVKNQLNRAWGAKVAKLEHELDSANNKVTQVKRVFAQTHAKNQELEKKLEESQNHHKRLAVRLYEKHDDKYPLHAYHSIVKGEYPEAESMWHLGQAIKNTPKPSPPIVKKNNIKF